MLELLTAGDADQAVVLAARAASLGPLEEGAQELLLRALVSAGCPERAAAHLAACELTFAREQLVPSAALRAAARGPEPRHRTGARAAAVASALLRAGTAALDAGAADAGIQTPTSMKHHSTHRGPARR